MSGLKCLQGWSIHRFLGQPVPVCHHPQSEKLPPKKKNFLLTSFPNFREKGWRNETMCCIQCLLTSFWSQSKLNSISSNPTEGIHYCIAVERLSDTDRNMLCYLLRSNRKPALCKGKRRKVFLPLISMSSKLKTNNWRFSINPSNFGLIHSTRKYRLSRL